MPVTASTLLQVQTVTIRLTVNQTTAVGNEEIQIAFTLCTLLSRDNFTVNNMGTVSFTVSGNGATGFNLT